MTSQQWTNGLIAVVIGSIVAVLLLVPVAAVLYRRRGEMTFGALVVLLAAGVYGVALWTYTLVPFPATVDYTCASPILEPFQSFRELRANGVRTPQLLASNAYFWQTALNVALFVPFGYFVRRVLGGGIFVAAVMGFTTSLLIEATQLTGVWGIFRCAYRFFELDDLMTNTAGAVIGSILSIALVSGRSGGTGRVPARPAHVTLGRRWMGLVCDLLWTVGTSVAVSVAFRVWHQYGPGDEAALGGRLEAWLGWTVAAALQGLVVIGAGRTLGEWTVALRTEALRPRLVLLSRLGKYVLGVGGFIALAAWDGPAWALPAFLVVTVLGTLPPGHVGLSNWLAGLRLRT
ncbi:VanZ family protein [Nocardioides gilvus]|uniref:VanZ family protein n=1 Tax=Nocardioides gilvus TaxID=1735589 RepID=UPI000D74526B|nr:VanZ family protein [Nocardioides gilvus]